MTSCVVLKSVYNSATGLCDPINWIPFKVFGTIIFIVLIVLMGIVIFSMRRNKGMRWYHWINPLFWLEAILSMIHEEKYRKNNNQEPEVRS